MDGQRGAVQPFPTHHWRTRNTGFLLLSHATRLKWVEHVVMQLTKGNNISLGDRDLNKPLTQSTSDNNSHAVS